MLKKTLSLATLGFLAIAGFTATVENSTHAVAHHSASDSWPAARVHHHAAVAALSDQG